MHACFLSRMYFILVRGMSDDCLKCDLYWKPKGRLNSPQKQILRKLYYIQQSTNKKPPKWQVIRDLIRNSEFWDTLHLAVDGWIIFCFWRSCWIIMTALPETQIIWKSYYNIWVSQFSSKDDVPIDSNPDTSTHLEEPAWMLDRCKWVDVVKQLQSCSRDVATLTQRLGLI